MYSPTITAGVSMEKRWFHVLTAYIELGPYAPGADAVLQMLYRVRDLSEGSMEVSVSMPTPGMNLPHTVHDVTAMLLGSQALTKRYLDDMRVHFSPIRTYEDDGSALYDRTSMSWDILDEPATSGGDVVMS
jgi:hypothetical protein